MNLRKFDKYFRIHFFLTRSFGDRKWLVVFAFLALFLNAATSNAQCPKTTLRGDTLDFGRVLVGATLDSTFTVRDSSVTDTLRDTVLLADPQFQLNVFGQFSFTSSRALLASFRPLKAENIARKDKWFPMDTATCAVQTIMFVGQGVDPTPDSSTIEILDNSNPFIGIRDTGATTSRLFSVKNNSGRTVQIDSIVSQDVSHFILTPYATFPKTLANGDSIQVQFVFSASDTVLHRSECIIATAPPLPGEIALQGIRTSLTNGVSRPTLSTKFAISVMPNPSHGSLTLFANGLRAGTVEVFDILGREIQSDRLSGPWTWNGQTSTGGAVPNGVYILRVTGIDAKGARVIASARVVIER